MVCPGDEFGPVVTQEEHRAGYIERLSHAPIAASGASVPAQVPA